MPAWSDAERGSQHMADPGAITNVFTRLRASDSERRTAYSQRKKRRARKAKTTV